MNVLVVGGGGREHAICWALRKSPRVDRLWCAPGNGGIASVAECVGIKATDIEGMLSFVRSHPVDFVMVAPDDPLALGMVDALESAGIRAFGPRKNAAIIEASKVFSKGLMKKYGIPTAEYEIFSEPDKAVAYICEKGAPIVVKADGLALGKGVIVAQDTQTAVDAVKSMMQDKKFGDSGLSVVIEEFMTGPEVTVLAFTDGETIVPMLSSQDHKRVFDNDEGPNTGGMGAICPSPNYTEGIADICMRTIFLPTIEAMKKEGRVFKGVIYFGLMLTPKGPRVVEYNARFGDPEAQPILSMLETDLLDIFEAVTDDRLSDIDIKWRPGAACCIVMASGGYPGSYEKGFEILGLDGVPADITVFHAGTALENSKYYTSGGRVLGVTAAADSLPAAVGRAYEGVGCIGFKNEHFRKDIGR
jgi:phosphoribosylamine---glycine ligase